MTSQRSTDLRYYARAIDALEERLEAAYRVKGLDEEIALIRSELQRYFHEHEGDIGTVLKITSLLVRIIAQHHRMQPKETRKLEDWTIESLKEVAAQFRPPDDDEV